MGYFKNIEIDVTDMFREGIKKDEIAKFLGISLTKVNEILCTYEYRDMDYDVSDTDTISYDDFEFDPNDTDHNSEDYWLDSCS
jgi:hypothetical protein